MREIRLSPAAISDVAGIRRYTRRSWGAQQASDYLKGLGRRFEEIAKGTQSVRLAELGYEKVRYRSHLILFRVEPDHVRIVRILRESMDLPRHLRSES